ncbi:MAG TPA: 4Fe-4S binding protein [Gaiellaceae bacterium]|nr:4Fe-4S binding protein [Gaiellaceae bacterium]
MSLVDLLGAVDSKPGRVETARGTVILLCSDLACDGLDLGGLERALGDRLPAAAVVVVEHLCERPAAAAPALCKAGAARAVIGLCRRRVPEAELRGRIRSGGASSCEVDIVRVPTTRGVPPAATALAAAAARLALMPSGEPSRAVPTPGGFSRAALLRLAPAVSLLPVAAVAAERCIGVSRCGLCVEACPAHAISSRDDAATVVASACETCGRCVTACPAGAVHIAGATRAQLQAQLAALLAEPSPAGVLFACARTVESLDDEPALDDWAVVELPALAVATPGWVLQTLAGGAPRVHLQPCAGDCCSPWQEGGASLELCRALLPAALAERVTAGGGALPARMLAKAPPQATRRLELAEPQATTLALRSLGVDGLLLEHPAAPLGLVDVASGCTACGACATACPTGALELADREDTIALVHDPSLCTGCGLCARVCPERVVHVTRGIDLRRLGGRLELACTRRRRCRLCGTLLPPEAVVERNRGLLAGTWPRLAGVPDDLCLFCARTGDTIALSDALDERRS